MLDTHHKALTLNLDAMIYGTFAEIGAGQEVARWFLRVGAASGTVAKTVSAYDKEVSDDLYGAGTRYVSRARLEAMLDQEWRNLLSQLQAQRGTTTRFFVFADTIAARNYAGTNECHGWMGIRFQHQPGADPSDVVVHVNMLDPSNPQQQEALGLLGVNLVYGVFHERANSDMWIEGLRADISAGRLEIDLVDLRGPAFDGWNRRALLVELVRRGIAEAVVFPLDGDLRPPTEVLHKKPVVLAPGTFEHVEPLHGRILATTLAATQKTATQPIGLFTLTTAAADAGGIAPETSPLLRRVEALQEQGAGTLLLQHRELYRTAAFVNRFTDAPVHFAVGLPLLVRIFQDAHYRNLEGRLLEGIARLFAQNVSIHAHPMAVAAFTERVRTLGAGSWTVRDVDGWATADGLQPPAPLHHLYAYLIASGFIVPMAPGVRG